MIAKHNTKYLSIIFFTGAVVLSLELLASRIMTPFFGVSLYIWTSILSVTLVFLAIGYQFGGWITSNVSPKYYKELFLFIPFISSIFIFISTIAYPILLPNLITQNLLLGSFIGSSLLLAIPLVLMSSLNPILISIIKNENNESNDSKSGFVLFVSTIGSVFGVIFSALVLIPNLTNFLSFILNAIFLTIYNLIIYFLIGYSSFEKLKKLFLFFNLILCIFLVTFFYFKESYLNYFTTVKDKHNNEYTILYEKPSFYGNYKVVGRKPFSQNEITQYILYQNGTMQNGMATLDHMGAFANLANLVEGHLFDAYFLSTLGNEEVFKFLEEENPEALQAMIQRFKALQESGLWVTRRNSIQAQLLAFRNDTPNLDYHS